MEALDSGRKLHPNGTGIRLQVQQYTPVYGHNTCSYPLLPTTVSHPDVTIPRLEEGVSRTFEGQKTEKSSGKNWIVVSSSPNRFVRPPHPPSILTSKVYSLSHAFGKNPSPATRLDRGKGSPHGSSLISSRLSAIIRGGSIHSGDLWGPDAIRQGDSGAVAQSKREDRKASGKESMKRGEEEKGKGEDRKASGREMANGREEKRRRMAGKDEEEDGDERGFIFMCSARTKPECYRSGVFGLPRGKMDVVEKIRPGAKLFLCDFDLKLMYGVYKADTRGGLDLVRHAFEGKFPAQVKFSVDIDCLPVPESSFKHAIKENYNSKGRFTQELSPKQVHRLLAIFKPIGLSQSSPQHIEETRRPRIVEDRREPYDYEERRLPQYVIERGVPIHARAYPLEDHYNITHSLRPPLLEEPRHILAPDPYHIQEPQHVPPKYYHQVATSSLNHQPHMDILHERTAAEPTVRDPLLARDYGALPGELAARSERVDELYRSYKLSTRAMDLQPGPSYVTTSYENPTSLYSEILQRPVVTRVRGPSIPVSTRYSFDALPPYR